jgi:hypothetical protein
MPSIFISFVHEDQWVAERVKALLEEVLNLEKDVFLSGDKRMVYAGDMWLEKIKAGLTDAKVVILMLSKRSMSRPWVNFEAGGAWLTNKVIIPCCYGTQTKGTLPHPYSSIQALDLADEMDFLVQSVHHHLGLLIPLPPNQAERGIARALKEQKIRDRGAQPSPLDKALASIDPYNLLTHALKDFEDEIEF